MGTELSNYAASENDLQQALHRHLLCEVDRVWDDGRLARVRPRYSQSAGGWVPIDVHTLKDEFPSQGLVFWPGPQFLVARGQIVLVTALALEDYFGQEGKYDRFKVVHGARAFECLVCETVNEEKSLHRLFSAEGLSLQVRPLTKSVYFQLVNGSILGPLPITENLGVLRCSQPDLVSRVHYIENARHCFQKLMWTDQQERLFLRADASLPAPTTLFNLEAPEVAWRGVLRRLREVSLDAGTAVERDFQLLEQYIKSLGEPSVSEPAKQVELARAKRVRSFVETLSLETFQLEEVARILAARPEIQQGVLRELGELAAKEKTRLERELVAEREKASEALRDIQREFTEAKNRLQGVSVEAERLTEEVSQKIRATVDEISRDPIARLSEHFVVRGLLGGMGAADRVSELSLIPRVDEGASCLEAISEASRRFAAGLASSGLYQVVGPVIVGGMLTGSVPVVCGAGADAVVKKLADSFCGGLMVRVSVPANTFSVTDLFGVYQGGEFVPRSLELQALPAIAENAPGPVLVVLEGINRAPVEVFLPSLVNASRKWGTGGAEGYDLGLAAGVAGGRSYRWPDNVMLMGTYVSGPSVFPVSVEGDSAVTFVPSILLSEVLGELVAIASTQEVTYLKRETWYNALESARAQTGRPSSPPLNLPPIASDVHIDNDILLRHVAESVNLGCPEGDALSLVFGYRMAVLADEGAFDDFARDAARDYKLYKEKWFLDSVRRIRGIVHRRER